LRVAPEESSMGSVGEGRRTSSTARDQTANQHRLTVHDAARRLGISEDAVRMRVKRGTLRSEREDGRLYVLLDADPTTDPTDRTDLLIAELQDRVRSLEEANRENRRIIAALTSRIPALEAPRESPVPTEEASEGARPHPGTEEPQEGTQRPWWRRMFGG
jgi:excisionase family DNA binding protein